jgi:hypothetical protein
MWRRPFQAAVPRGRIELIPAAERALANTKHNGRNHIVHAEFTLGPVS